MILKVIEVLASSKLSWEDAAKVAIREAAKSVYNIRSIYIKDHSAKVVDDQIVEYRVTADISFTLADSDDQN